LVSAQHPAWTRHDLLKQLASVLPSETRRMSPEEAQALLLGLAEEALSGRSGEVVCLEAPEWPPVPAALRRELDGCSIYQRPGVARYATAAQLTLEERLVAHAQTQGAPRLADELAARRLGAELAQIRAALADRACCPALKMPMSEALRVPMVRGEKTPPGGAAAGFSSVRCRSWSAWCRWCQSMTSVTAERAAGSSTRFLPAANAATRDCRARLLTARG
jgi:hypothetical protein